MPEINVLIKEDGEIQIDVKGAKGADCAKLTEDIEDALGDVQSRKKKPEFYQKSEQKARY
jgi:hypothetical protein